MPAQIMPSIFRFGPFELDRKNFELRRDGQPLKLDHTPLELLFFLVENAGTLVTREQAVEHVWGKGVFIEADASLYTAVRKIRRALGDDTGEPQFIQTVSRKGYRFIAKREEVALVSSPPAAPLDTGHRKRRSWLVLRSFGWILLTGIALVWIARHFESVRLSVANSRSETPVPVVVRFAQLTSDGQEKSGPMATDGTRIYFNEILAGQLRVPVQVSAAGGEVVHLSTPLNRPRVLDISPDGTELLMGNQEATGADSLWIQPLAGGSPRRIGSMLVNSAAWSPDKKTIVYGNGNNIFVMNEDGTPRSLLSLSNSPDSPRFSPAGNTLRFSLHDQGTARSEPDSTSIIEISFDGGNLRKLFPGCCGTWTSDGRYFIFQNASQGRMDLWALRETSATRSRAARPSATLLTTGPLGFEAPIPSKTGKDIFAIGSLRRSEIVRYDRRSRKFVPYLPGVSAEGLAFSRDGKWVTYTSYPDGTLWRSKIDGSDRLQLTFSPMRATLPRWSPDAGQIAFMAYLPHRPWNIYLVPANGGTPKQMLADARDRMDANWSPDGNSLVFGSFDVPPNPNNPISILDLKTSHVSTIPGSVGLFSPRWSPDGRYICAITAERPFKLMIFDFTDQKWTQLSDDDIGFPNWSHNGRYIYFSVESRHNQSARIDRIRLRDHKVETILHMGDVGRSVTGTFAAWSGLAPDDSPLLSRDISTKEIYALQWEMQ